MVVPLFTVTPLPSAMVIAKFAGTAPAVNWYHWPAVTEKRSTSTSPEYCSEPLCPPGVASGAPATVLGKSSAPRSLT